MTLVTETVAPISNGARAPSFVDLRAFAIEAEPALQAVASDRKDDAFLANRVPLLNARGTSPVAALRLPADSGCVDALPHDEFIVVLEGRLNLVAGRQAHALDAGDAAVIPHGCRFTWRAEGIVTAILLTYPESRAAGRTITPIRKDPPLEPSAKPAPEVLLGPAPDCRNFNDYRVDEGKFVCGTWDSTAYRRKGFLYGHYEIMLIEQGSVTFGDETGRTGTFGTGSLVLAEAGSQCSWDSGEPVTKMFAIYRT